jgi:cysteine synthase
MGHERLEKLSESLGKFSFREGGRGVRPVHNIRKRILEERATGSTETIDYFGERFMRPRVQGLLGIKEPKMADYSRTLDLLLGSVYGLEFRSMGPSGSHKDLMIASLFSMNMMAGAFDGRKIDTLVDSGIFNSMLATKSLCTRFGFNGVYYIPEGFPEKLINSVRGYNFDVVEVPMPEDLSGVENKAVVYRELLKRFHKDKDFAERALYLGHAELGYFSTYPYGRAFAESMKVKGVRPDIFLTGMGAGTTAIGIGEPLQDAFGTDINLSEYEEFNPVTSRIPDKFRGVVRPMISDEEYLDLMRKDGRSMGITSAGGLVLGGELARDSGKKTVVVPVFERYRDYRNEQGDARAVISRKIQLNPFVPEDFWDRVGGVYHLEKRK